MKQLKKYNNMLGCIADAHYGIPTGCPCWGRMVDEVSPGKKFPGDFDTLPGRKYFVCDKFEVLFHILMWALPLSSDDCVTFHMYESGSICRMMDSTSVNHGSSRSRMRLLLKRVDEMAVEITELKDELKRVRTLQ